MRRLQQLGTRGASKLLRFGSLARSHTLSAPGRDEAASTSLRLVGVLDPQLTSARRPARASYPQPGLRAQALLTRLATKLCEQRGTNIRE